MPFASKNRAKTRFSNATVSTVPSVLSSKTSKYKSCAIKLYFPAKLINCVCQIGAEVILGDANDTTLGDDAVNEQLIHMASQ